MAFKKRYTKKGGNDKYLRLTGLWPSKNNDKLMSGRLRAEEVEKLLEKCQEAIEADSPLVFGLWENEQESRKDPVFSLQCFVGDSEEKPKSRFGSSKKKSSRDEEEEDASDDADEEEEQEEEEEEEKPKKKSAKRTSSSW